MNTVLRLLVCFLIILPLILNAQQIENPGFENWEDAGTVKDEPVDWSTIKTCDDPGIGAVAPVTFDQCDTAHTGNYSLRLYNVYVYEVVATGAITNGRFHAEFNLDSTYSYTQHNDPRWHSEFPYRPDSLTGWFQYYPQGNDNAQFKIILHVDECKLPEFGTMPNWVGMAVFNTEPGVTYDEWTRFSAPVIYFREDLPEYQLTVLNSGDSTVAVTGSWLLVDDLELIYPSSGISERKTPEPFLVQLRNSLEITLDNENDYIDQWFYVIDITGKTVLSEKLESNRILLPETLKEGIYVAVLEGQKQQYVQKIALQ
jgi:hypothetical protein